MKKLLIIAIPALLALTLPGSKPPAFKLPKGLTYCYVPSGTTTFQGKTVSAQSFYMFQTEITNFHYHEYLADLKKSGMNDQYIAALPDTNAWTRDLKKGSFEAFRSYYFSHPSYRDYPVVNVSYDQVQKYCGWLTEKLNIKLKDKGVSVVVRLPHQAEYYRACEVNGSNTTYAWPGNSLRNNKGLYRCNFMALDAANIHYNDSLKNYEVITTDFTGNAPASLADQTMIIAPAISYEPNGFGFYNLNGNVAEMCQERGVALGGHWQSTGYDVRNASVYHYTGPDPRVGFRVVFTVLNSAVDK